ncbi:MAG: hypothetical protein LBE98_04200 [Puniceicoccales bacterium]|jgi:hypothetical protein|nr:hypothetical protein [Puniceicoccales bacterium]
MNIRVANASMPRIPSAIPNDEYVDVLRAKGFEVCVFQNASRRMVAIKFPYSEDSEDIWDVYDSELEDHGSFPIKTLLQRDVEVLQNDPTFVSK